MKIRKGDLVLIISGKYRGKTGKVLRVFSKEKKILVEGINLVKKHIRPKKAGEKGQTIKVASPLSVSNVKLICSGCKKATRVRYKIEGDNKYRICKKCQQET